MIHIVGRSYTYLPIAHFIEFVIHSWLLEMCPLSIPVEDFSRTFNSFMTAKVYASANGESFCRLN